MSNQRIVVIDDTQVDQHGPDRVVETVWAALEGLDADVQVVRLDQQKIGRCVGCYQCWLRTPGLCAQKDAGVEIARAVLNSHLTIFISPLVFGSYTPGFKRLVDRMLSPLNQPYMSVSDGETHHLPRYPRYPRLVGIGIQPNPDPTEERLFKALVGRNALQVHAPSYAAAVVSAAEAPSQLRVTFQALITRRDPWPRPSEMQALLRETQPSSWQPQPDPPGSSQSVLLLTGSPKGQHSTSAALGEYLLDRLRAHGCQTETWMLRADGQVEVGLLEVFDQAHTVVLSFPLYNDALPYGLIQALQTIAASRAARPGSHLQRLVAICNNGFPERHHTALALGICRQFAQNSRLQWAGGLALGAGEALSAGQPLLEIRRAIPSVKHVRQALDLAAASLSEGQPIPEQAVRLMANTPLPAVPFWLWRRIFLGVAAKRWEGKAARNGVGKAMLLAQPLLETRPGEVHFKAG